ncbi:MAG: DEAD/DEAH box helicase family protein [Candidatus Woesearchaeota archaeon]
MSNKTVLYEEIPQKAYELGLTKPEVPEYIINNVKFDLYKWQKEALENFLIFNQIKESEKSNCPTHLMFHMATGSGKTLVMASLLLYYYKQGYRHFIFFVNANNVVDKTEYNFLDSTHNKYLYKNKIVIDDKLVNIKKVEVFSDFTDDIEIKFTTIQQLYNDIHIEKENKTILSDLHEKDIVMLADEAHHLNTTTKKYGQLNLDLESEITGRTGKKEIERKGWEHTVIELILNKKRQYTENKNVLLEFTATIPDDKNVIHKYRDKIIYRFSLKEFLQAGYTKEINLISSTFEKKERILQALLFSWYRYKIAIKYDIFNFKPVILFRSKSIAGSRRDYKYFLKLVRDLQPEDFNFLKQIDNKIIQTKSIYEQGKSRTWDVIEFIKREGIHYYEIVNFIKFNFRENNCIITNSEDNTAKTVEKTTEEQERLLNNLEDINNHIRAIFTVKRLTEGWDVQNLYDIVRLYKGQNTGGSTRQTPKATIQEKQLIGRGVRYYPFIFQDKTKNKRKFDDNVEHELRILEELFYYTYDEKSRYISHLKNELRKDGYILDDKIKKTFKIKDDFKKTDFYKDIKILYNTQEKNPDRKKQSLNDISKDFFGSYKLNNIELIEQEIGTNEEKDINRLDIHSNNLQTITVKISEFERHIFYKAINIKAAKSNSLFQFDKLKEELAINRIEDLLKDEFLGDFEINIVCQQNEKFEDIANQKKIMILLEFMDKFSKQMKAIINPTIGSEFKFSTFKNLFDGTKTKIVEKDTESKLMENELIAEDWYVLNAFHGTDEEKYLIDFIKNTIGNLQKKYKEVYLLRNEEVYTIYNFNDGRGFQPDFLLFLKDNNKENFYYQIFIEPKGEHIIKYDSWKNDFLEQITKKYGIDNILEYENKLYSLIGLPLFNNRNKKTFKCQYDKIIKG